MICSRGRLGGCFCHFAREFGYKLAGPLRIPHCPLSSLTLPPLCSRLDGESSDGPFTNHYLLISLASFPETENNQLPIENEEKLLIFSARNSFFFLQSCTLRSESLSTNHHFLGAVAVVRRGGVLPTQGCLHV